MLVLVPEPVWNTSMGKCASCAPSATCCAADSIATGQLRWQQAEAGVGGRGGVLDQGQRANEAARHGQAADRKVLDRALRLRTPERVGWNLQLSHAVSLDAERWRTHVLT